MLCSQPNELERSKKMKELLDKLSSYNIFNYLFPGILFCVISKTLIGYNLIMDDIVLGVFLYYFIGLTISRMGLSKKKWTALIIFKDKIIVLC